MKRIALISMFCLLAGPATAQFSILGLKNSMVQFLLEQISVPGEFEVTAKQVEEPESGVTAITGLAIADSQGVWLKADSLNFSWSPSRLLLGEIDFSNLALTGVDVLRQPVSTATEEEAEEETDETSGGFKIEWPRSPLALKISRMALEDVNVAEAVLGHAIEFDATGNAEDQGDIQAVTLNMTRLDAVEGVINFSYSQNFAEDTLSLHLDAKEGPDGMIAALTGLPAEAPTTAKIDASGPPEDWKMTLDIALAETLNVDGNAAISYAGPLKVDAEVNARPGPLLDPDLAALIGDEAEIKARAAEGENGLLVIEEGHLHAPDIDLTASGTYARPTGAADLKVDLAARSGLAAPIEGVDFGGLGFVGTITGAPGTFAANGDLQLQKLLTPSADIADANLAIRVTQTTPEEEGAVTTTAFDVAGSTVGLRIDKIGPDVLGDPDLKIAGALTGSDLTLDMLGLTSKVIQLAVQGDANIETLDANVSLNLSAPDFGPVAAAYDQDVTGAINAEGTAIRKDGVLDVDFKTGLAGFRHEMADAESLTLALKARNEGEKTDFDLTGNGVAMRVDKLTPEILGKPEFKLAGDLDGDALTLDTLSLASVPLNVTASGTADLTTQDADIAFKVSAPQMEPVAALYGQQVAGAIAAEGTVKRLDEAIDLNVVAALTGLEQEFVDARALDVTVSVQNEGTRTAFDVEGMGEQIRLDKIPPELLGEVAFATSGVLDDNALTLDPTTIDTNLLKAEASGELDIANPTGAIAYKVTTGSLAPITRLYDVALDGNAAVEGTVTMAQGVPTIVGNAQLAGVVFDGARYGDLVLDHDVTVGDAPAGTLKANLSKSPYGNAKVATDFVFAAPELTLKTLTADALGMSLRGNLALDTEATLAEGKLTLASSSITPLSGLAGTDLGGTLNGQVTLTRPNGRQNAVATLKATDVYAAEARIAAVDLNAKLSNLLGTPGIDTTILIDGVEADDLTVSRITATAQGPLSGMAVTASAKGEMKKDPIALAIAAQVDGEGPQLGARIDRFDASLGDEAMALNQPLTIRAQGARLTVTDMDISLPRDGRLVGEVDKYGNGMKGTIRLSDLDASLAKRFADAPILAGRVAADAVFDTGRGPANLILSVSDLKLDAVDTGSVLNFNAEADWDGRIATTSGKLTGGFGKPLTFDASLPVRRGLVPTLARSGPVEAEINWEGKIGKIWAMVPAAGNFLTGDAKVNLGVAGDISDPKIDGGMTITDGGFQNLDAGTILTDLTLDTEITPDGALRFDLNAVDGGSGTVKTTGEVALDQSGIEIKTVIDKAVLVRRDDVTARIDGNIDVTGPVSGLDVTGAITLETVEVRLVSNASANIVDLGDVTIKGAPPPEEDEAGSSISLDLTINSPGRVFVRGRGLQSTWGVDMKVQGTAAKPIVTGRVEKVRGTLSLIAKSFDLTRGQIDFEGGDPIDPRLDITFERETDDLTGRIVITGKSSDPKLNFTSSPSLPEDEVLPRTIFGKSSQALTGSQAIQLGIGIATLMNGDLDGIRGLAGLDSLSVDQDDDGNASLSAGKEVADGVYVGVKQGFTSGESSAVVEVDVIDDVTIDAEVGLESGSTVGVKWKRDF
ncbi:translocation/assembly module TamB domain-containing protein [Rhodobacteraceae bacterium NNCM2]|nr:translocation/assembly module TamB domain-containing protein [Coraliihabitans acroporae]